MNEIEKRRVEIKIDKKPELLNFGENKKGETFIGTFIPVTFKPDVASKESIDLKIPYILNASEPYATDSSLYFDTRRAFHQTTDLLGNDWDLIRETLRVNRVAINSEILKANPNFFKDINAITAKQNAKKNVITDALLHTTTSIGTKPCLVAGLAGYGKTTIISNFFKDLSKMKSPQEIAEKYGISPERAETMYQRRPQDIITILINNNLELPDLITKVELVETENGNTSMLSVTNELGKAFKNRAYLGMKSVAVIMDELLDNENLIQQFKAVFMQNSNGDYVLPSQRNLGILKANIETFSAQDPKKNIKTDFVLVEKMNSGDNNYAIPDDTIQIIKEKNKATIKIDADKLNPYQANALFNYSLPNEKHREMIAQDPKQRNLFFKSRTDELKKGGCLLPISNKKFKEIEKALRDEPDSYINISPESSAFVFPANNLMVVATGNNFSFKDVAMLSRFNTAMIDGISFDELNYNIGTMKYGIKTPVIEKLQKLEENGTLEKGQANEIFKEITASIVDYVKHIDYLQRSEQTAQLPMPDFPDGVTPVYSPTKLSSTGLNPRLITEVINSCYEPTDIAEEFLRRSDYILGIVGLASEEDEAAKNMLRQITEEHFIGKFNNIEQKYNINFNMAEKIMSSKKDFQNAIKALPSANLEEEISANLEEENSKPDEDEYDEEIKALASRLIKMKI